MKQIVCFSLAAFLAGGAVSVAQPSITTQPQDLAANQGFAASFRLTAAGTQPLEYQWFFVSNAIPSAVTNILTVTNAQPIHAGEYFAVVSDAAGGSITSRVARLTIVGPSPLDPKVGPNRRLGEDTPELAGRPHQAEPHIARSYSDPNLVIATFQDGLGSTHEPIACSYAWSTDGGINWVRQFIPGLTRATGGTRQLAGDNVVALDLVNNPVIVSATLSVQGNSYVDVLWVQNASTNHGETFGLPQPLVSETRTDYPDKGWVAINSFLGSKTAGRIAFAYTRISSGGFGQRVDLHYIISDDGGSTWAQPRLIGSPMMAVQNLFLPDGSLALLYWRFSSTPAPNPNGGRIEMILSEDDGQSFAAPVVAMNLTGAGSISPYNDPNSFSGHFVPSACVDRQAGVIYVANQGTAGTGTNRAPRILFTKSIDKGRTWIPPIAVNDTLGKKPVFNPGIAVSPDGQHVTIEFYDRRNQTNSSANVADLYLAESFDGGDTWQPNIRISEFTSDLRKATTEGGRAFLGDYQAMVPSLNFDVPAVACWIDTRAGNADPYVARINRTQGATFETWRKLRFSTGDLVNPELSGELADPDGDKIPNLAEYACCFREVA